MSRTGSNLIFTAAALLLVGAGAWLLTTRKLAAEIAAVQSAPDPEVKRLEEENRTLKQQRAATVAKSAAASAATSMTSTVDRTRQAQITAELFKSGLLGQRAWPFPERNSLTTALTDIADILVLNPEEAAALQQVGTRMREEFIQAVKKHASVDRVGGMATITVPQHSDISSTYDRMMASLLSVLGPERARAFADYGGQTNFTRIFALWGLQGTTIKVTYGLTPPDEFWPQGFDPRENVGPPPRSYYWYSPQPLTPPPASTTTFSGGSGRSGGGGGGGGGPKGAETIPQMDANIGPLYLLVPTDLAP